MTEKRKRDALIRLLGGEAPETVFRDLEEGEGDRRAQRNEITKEKQEAISTGVMYSCIILGGLVGMVQTYDVAVNDLFLSYSFWDALWLSLLYGVGWLFAGVTFGGLGSFLVMKMVHGVLFLFWPAYRRGCQRQNDLITHESVWTLLGVNLFVMGRALYEQWDLSFLLWVYWLQSMLLGICWSMFTTYICSSVEGLHFRGLQKVSAYFWGTIGPLIPYGILHLIFLGFLIDLEPHPPWEVFLYGGLFLAELVWSLFRNKDNFKRSDLNYARLFHWPFLRLLPLLIIPFVAYGNPPFAGTTALALFMIGKIILDQIMHVQQLRGFSRRPGDDYDSFYG